MSDALTFSQANGDVAALVREALVPEVPRKRVTVPCGHIEFREGFTDAGLRGCVAVLGVFDGFHVGHAKLVSDAIDSAGQFNKPVVAVTFWPDPCEILGHPEGRLMDERQRVDALLRAGVAAVIVLRFDERLMNLAPAAFVDSLMRYLSPSELHVGENFSFGFRGEGTAGMLVSLCDGYGIPVKVSELFRAEGAPVSATRIRDLISKGRLEEARTLMGRPLSLPGVVGHGRGEGRGFGFATANLLIERERVLLAPGVYAGYTVVKGTAWPTAANAGTPASFGSGDDNLIEAHLVGFSEAIYGENATFVPLTMLRAEQRFTTRDELVNTVMGNIDWVAQNLGSCGLEVGV